VAVSDRVLAKQGLEAKESDSGHCFGCDTPEHPRIVAGPGRTIKAQNVLVRHVAVRRPEAKTALIGDPGLVTDYGAVELLEEAPWSSS